MGRSCSFPGNVSGAHYCTPKTWKSPAMTLTQKEANVCNLDSFTKAFSYILLKVPAHFKHNKIFSFSYYTVQQHSCPQKHQRAFLDQLCVPGRRPKCFCILFDLLQDQAPGAFQVKEVISEVLFVYDRKLLHFSVILASSKYNVTNTGLALPWKSGCSTGPSSTTVYTSLNTIMENL